jgi:hypothetical protein
VRWALAGVFALQIAFSALQPRHRPRPRRCQCCLGAVLWAVSLGDPIALMQMLTLYPQAF